MISKALQEVNSPLARPSLFAQRDPILTPQLAAWM